MAGRGGCHEVGWGGALGLKGSHLLISHNWPAQVAGRFLSSNDAGYSPPPFPPLGADPAERPGSEPGSDPGGAGRHTLLDLKIAYFDQLRHQLDEDKTVQENVGDG